jgi:hypothetical protein
MKWRVRKPNARVRALKMWHKWFAWYPVRVPTEGRMSGMTMVWLKTIKRKGYFNSIIYYRSWWEWKYKV